MWWHFTTWMLPLQIVRGFLIALVLYPFLWTLRSWGDWQRLASIAGLDVMLAQWASTLHDVYLVGFLRL